MFDAQAERRVGCEALDIEMINPVDAVVRDRPVEVVVVAKHVEGMRDLSLESQVAGQVVPDRDADTDAAANALRRAERRAQKWRERERVGLSHRTGSRHRLRRLTRLRGGDPWVHDDGGECENKTRTKPDTRTH